MLAHTRERPLPSGSQLDAEARRELIREVQRGADPHQLPAQAAVDGDPSDRRCQVSSRYAAV